MTILVTGGAGYIGSHCVRQLVAHGRSVCVVDNLSRGHRAALTQGIPFQQCDLSETDRLAELMRAHRVECVIHFAGLAYVWESKSDPLLYYENNVAGTISLLRAMKQADVKRIVFSSSCATYGVSDELPIRESTPQRPIHPYGRSKLFAEQILQDLAAADSEFGYVILRYFNVAGCSADGSLGEDHDPQTRLIPVALLTALGQRDHVTIHGSDYPTPDGTCIRDYLHVDDLCAAHLAATDALQNGDARIYNLGIGRGYSVREVITSAERVTSCNIPILIGDQRAGDPPALFADATKIRRELNWSPQYTDLDGIVETAWHWMSRHPQGYQD